MISACSSQYPTTFSDEVLWKHFALPCPDVSDAIVLVSFGMSKLNASALRSSTPQDISFFNIFLAFVHNFVAAAPLFLFLLLEAEPEVFDLLAQTGYSLFGCQLGFLS